MQPTTLPSRLQPVARLTFVKFSNKKELPSREVSEVVYLIDEEANARESMLALLRLSGLEAVGFESANEYIAHTRHDSAACVILDFHLRDVCALELARELKKQCGPPVIFISAAPDVANTVCAMRAGAMDFFAKPVDPGNLLAAVRSALEQHRKFRQKEEELTRLKGRLSLLTPREREVLPLVVGGVLNQRAAAILGISKVTLQIHRSQVMRKMGADSVADLVRMAVKLRIPYRQESQLRESQSAQALTGEGHQRTAWSWGPGLVTS